MKRVGFTVAGAVLVSGGALLFGLADTKKSNAAEVCTPAVMVIRHAEDGPNPAGGADILSAAGKRHAALYPELFRKYLAKSHGIGHGGAEVSVCPIGKIIALNPNPNPENRSPGSNPYKTIEPLEPLNPSAKHLGLPIHVKDAAGVSYSTVYDWDTERRKTLLENGSSAPTSTVIAWDKQGLNPSAEDLSTKFINGRKLGEYHVEFWVPLLKAFPSHEARDRRSGAYYHPPAHGLLRFFPSGSSHRDVWLRQGLQAVVQRRRWQDLVLQACLVTDGQTERHQAQDSVIALAPTRVQQQPSAHGMIELRQSPGRPARQV